VGANLTLGLGEANSDRVREALKKLDFLVVQDIFMNETGEYADVILPASSFAEKEGTVTNTERRIQRIRQGIEPIGATKPDLQIIAMIGKRLGVDVPSTDPKQVLEEIARVVPQYGGVSYSRLDMTEFLDDDIPMPAAVSHKQLKVKSLMWPCPERLDPGTPVLYTQTFATKSGKALMSAAWQGEPRMAEEPAGGVLMATVGFPLFPFRTGTLSRQSYALSRVEPDPRLHLNSRDAARLGIGDQAPVQVTIEGVSSGEPIYAVSLIHDRVPEGRAFLAITMEQAGTNRGVREARQAIQDGERKAVPITVQPAPHMSRRPMSELAPVATANVLDSGRQPL
jgi:predicted molibdopterin-dependent oxidoreductase YjgC